MKLCDDCGGRIGDWKMGCECGVCADDCDCIYCEEEE